LVHSGQVVTGAAFNEPMRAETVQPAGNGSWSLGLVGTRTERFRRVTLSGSEMEALDVLDSVKTFDADGRLLRLGLQAYALGIAPLGDERLAANAAT
jgi:hypothetical protein